MDIEWRQVVGYEGWYSVSSAGDVRRDRTVDIEAGSVVGRLSVVERGPSVTNARGKTNRFYVCRCECGTVKTFRADHLLRGLSRSCGCARRTGGASIETHIVTSSRLLRPDRTRGGYLLVALSVPGRRLGRFLVHRLVAAAFIAPLPEGAQVNHKNGKPDDNRADNLEYVTASGNVRHSYDTLGREPNRGTRNGQATITEEIASAIKTAYAEMRGARRRLPMGGAKILARRFGVPHRSVLNITAGRTWRHAK